MIHQLNETVMINLQNIATYLNEKKVPFAISKNYETGVEKIVGVKIAKSGKFFTANGIVISGNFAKELI